MKIIHYYIATIPMIDKYIETLLAAIGDKAETMATASFGELRRECKRQKPDIIHVHGCWQWEMSRIKGLADKVGARIVITPHGMLQPWAMKQQRKSRKMPMTMLFQKKLIAGAYAVVAMGRMEAESLGAMGWNRRIETVKNSLVTDSITPVGMAANMLRIYHKVYDTAPRHYMKADTVDALHAFIKVGLSGDSHFIDDMHYNACAKLDHTEWRKIFLYAHQESILGIVARGVQLLELPFPDIDPTTTEYYRPTDYREPAPFDTKETRDSTDEVAAMITSARLLAARGKLTMYHLTKIANALLHSTIDEERAREQAYRMKGKGFTRRLMQILSQETLLEEGFLIAPTANGMRTRRILRNIIEHNEI